MFLQFACKTDLVFVFTSQGSASRDDVSGKAASSLSDLKSFVKASCSRCLALGRLVFAVCAASMLTYSLKGNSGIFKPETYVYTFGCINIQMIHT